MPRVLRIQYPGAIYHVMNRGDHREPIFRDDLDYKRFLTTLAEACTKTDWQVRAYCLMGNHFHLLFETPGANLVAGMCWFLSTYTARFKAIRRGWCLGDETYRKELLESVGASEDEPYRADARRETTEEMARRILNEELDKLGWTGAELAGRAKGDVRKIRIARLLWADTAVTPKWIAAELHMGNWTPVANQLSDNSEQPDNQPDLNLCQK